MKRFFTLTLFSALMLTAGTSPAAQRRAAAPVRQETRAEKPDGAAADEDFASANREACKLTGKLAEDRKYADRFVEAARAQDRAKTEALLKEAGVRGEFKVDAGSVAGDERDRAITITICVNKTCITIIITRYSAA